MVDADNSEMDTLKPSRNPAGDGVQKVRQCVGLSDRAEHLVMAYLDGECGWWKRRQAERLIAHNPIAREFIERMHLTCQTVRELSKVDQGACWSDPSIKLNCSLWETVAARISHEERSKVWDRSAKGNGSGRQKAIRIEVSRELLARLQWGFSGAALAGLVAVLIVPRSDMQQSPYALQSMAAGQHAPAGLSPVGYVSNQRPLESNGQRVVMYPSQNEFASTGMSYVPDMGSERTVNVDRYPRALEVDWMRSGGRVRMLHDPEERSAIIWVRPNGAGLGRGNTRDISGALARQGISSQSSSDEPLRMVDR